MKSCKYYMDKLKKTGCTRFHVCSLFEVEPNQIWYFWEYSS